MSWKRSQGQVPKNYFKIFFDGEFGILGKFPLTLYDPGGGALKVPPPIFCSHAFNIGAALLCVGDFSQKIV